MASTFNVRASVPVHTAIGASETAFLNAQRNRAAVDAMTEAERLTGRTAEQLRDEMHEQRARVLARYGLQEAA